jgi:hypothetical protein
MYTILRDSVVGIATGYGLHDRGVGVRVLVGQEFSLLEVFQTGCGGPPNLLCNGYLGLVPRGQSG